MKINAVKCKECGDIIWSRAQHDFHWCSCDSVAVDGGPRLERILGEPKDYETLEIDLPITEREAYNDWNFGKNKLGIIYKNVENEFLHKL